MTMQPIRRAANPTEYVANDASVPLNGSKVGKNSLLSTSAAAVPYKKKSYHSIVVPIRLASATRRIDPCLLLFICPAIVDVFLVFCTNKSRSAIFRLIRCRRQTTPMIGTRLQHYEITSHLGSGGMGEVYQATDSKLGRSVAIKVLPQTFTRDADRVARFE